MPILDSRAESLPQTGRPILVRRVSTLWLLVAVIGAACTGRTPTAPWATAAPESPGTSIPLTLVNIQTESSGLYGGGATRGIVTLSIPAPAGGTVVALASDDPNASVPPSVTVPAGATEAAFAITTRKVLRDTAVALTGSFPPPKVLQTRFSVWAEVPVSYSWIGEPGEFISGGTAGRITAETGTFRALCEIGSLSINIDGGGLNAWSFEFNAGIGKPLRPGTYENTTSSGAGFFPTAQPGLRVGGMGHGCDSTGRFVVSEAEINRDGTVSRFVATFEQRCANNTGPKTLAGELRLTGPLGSPNPFSRECLR